MNLLLERSPRLEFSTDLRAILAALGGRAREYEWLVTDLELLYLDPLGALQHPLPLPVLLSAHADEVMRLSGSELERIAGAYRIQVLWGVFSGFRPDAVPVVSPLDPYPFANGNPDLWKPEVTLQHPTAQVELVCWDSSATLFLSRDADLARRFREQFPDAVDPQRLQRAPALGAARERLTPRAGARQFREHEVAHLVGGEAGVHAEVGQAA